MPEYQGRLLQLKIGDNAASEAFATLGGLQGKSLTINNEPVDVSNGTDGRWRKLLAQAGLTSVSINANGVFQDDAAVEDLLTYVLDGTIHDFQMVHPNGETWDFQAQVTSFEFSGDHNAAQQYTVSLENSGAVTITS